MKRKFLTQAEVDAILRICSKSSNAERDYCLIYMCYVHGFRVSEVTRLCLSDLDLVQGYLYIRRLKNGFSTVHPLMQKEIKVLKAWLNVRARYLNAESDWLFLSRKGNPLSRQQFYKIIKHLGSLAGIGILSHPHMLRHACGFALADKGVDTRLIQDYLGHRNIRHTVRYTASNAKRFWGIWRAK